MPLCEFVVTAVTVGFELAVLPVVPVPPPPVAAGFCVSVPVTGDNPEPVALGLPEVLAVGSGLSTGVVFETFGVAGF